MLSIQGAFAARNAKGKIYKEEVVDKEKEVFKKELRKLIEEIINNIYVCGYVDDKTHCECIKKIQEESRKYGEILHGGALRIGIIQKLFNLYLKYLWCLGLIEMPPHMPIDSIVLKKLKRSERWTEIDSCEDYMAIINVAKEAAKSKPLPIWELEYFNDVRELNMLT